MITARNYAAQAEHDFRKASHAFEVARQQDFHILLLNGADFIKQAIHFAIPDGGKILMDNLRGIRGEEIHLPFKKITVEFFYDKYSQETSDIDDLISSKYLILAEEFENEISVVTCQFDNKKKKWGMQNVAIFIPINWDSDKGKTFDGLDGVGCRSMSLTNPSDVDSDEFQFTSLVASITAPSILALIEALSCKNVGTESINRIDQTKADKRVRAGKLPFYETKILTVETNYESKVSNRTIPTDRAVVRQHLRRGHIRRHPTAGNIWVNSCVVGHPELGVIEKQYKVR